MPAGLMQSCPDRRYAKNPREPVGLPVVTSNKNGMGSMLMPVLIATSYEDQSPTTQNAWVAVAPVMAGK